MPKDTMFNSINQGTLRPNTKPLWKKGDTFYSIDLPKFGWEIIFPENVSSDDLIILFIMYYTPEIIDIMV
jgi:hypothetical protein